jgi:hypothetical protein
MGWTDLRQKHFGEKSNIVFSAASRTYNDIERRTRSRESGVIKERQLV